MKKRFSTFSNNLLKHPKFGVNYDPMLLSSTQSTGDLAPEKIPAVKDSSPSSLSALHLCRVRGKAVWSGMIWAVYGTDNTARLGNVTVDPPEEKYGCKKPTRG